MLAACGFVRDETINGPYRLVAVDVPEEVGICYALESGDCLRRIPDRVTAVAYNAEYVVAEVTGAGAGFYYIIRASDGPLVDPSVSVRGPLSATAFEQEQSRLGLPVPLPVD
jgi:hypothetical protein